ncbi:HU family DNA-binding protein [Sporolactobacillus shoreicorticis]|uniref:Uncharacterized protein n=1 Tax=Sporolactobacillus shoreicorticis TaxID=1923877 RepID=A0ABW5S6M1_9BACL
MATKTIEIDTTELVNYIAEKTGLDLDDVYKMIDAHDDFLKEKGIIVD